MGKGKAKSKGKAKKGKKGAASAPSSAAESVTESEDHSPSESEEPKKSSISDPAPPRSSKDASADPAKDVPGTLPEGQGATDPSAPPPSVRATLQPDPAEDPPPPPDLLPQLTSQVDGESAESETEGDEGAEEKWRSSRLSQIPPFYPEDTPLPPTLTTRQIVQKLLSSRIGGARKLVDILNPKKPFLPVDVPAISDIRKQNWIAQPKTGSTGSMSRTGLGSKTSLSQTAANMMKMAGVVPHVQGDDGQNPFHYPVSIEEFIAKDDADHIEERKKTAKIPPLMKGTVGYKQSQLVLERIKPFLHPSSQMAQSYKPSSTTSAYKRVVWRAQNGLHVNHLQKVSRKLHREYIMQRKAIYYLRRAIRTRKIALEMIARTRDYEEAALKDYEWLTDFTKEAFEAFLKENDEKTHEAARAAEAALKEKLDKTLEVRQLCIKINQMKSEIISTNESLKECKTYMRFLDDIAKEIMRKDEEAEIRAQAREQQIKEELIVLLKQGMSLKQAQETVEENAKSKYEEYFMDGKHRASLGSSTSTDFLANLQKDVRKYLGMPEEVQSMEEIPEEEMAVVRSSYDDTDEPDIDLALDDGDETFNENDLPSPKSILSGMVTRTKSRLLNVIEKQEQELFEKLMLEQEARREIKDEEDEDGFNEFALIQSLDLVPGDEESDRRELAGLSFTRPSQLLQIYTDMEESNLSLIQHSQASEESLDRVNHQILNTRKGLNHKGRLLREEINRMQASIDINEERANALAQLVEMFTGGNYDVKQQQKLYKILQTHVARVYKAAVGTTDHHLNPLMMLTSIEKNFEDLMHEIQAMPTDVVVQISRELDKERREMERLIKMTQRKKVQDDRKTRQLDRAKAPIPRRKGRQLLPRSRPPKAVIKLSQAELDKKAEEDEFNYFFGP